MTNSAPKRGFDSVLLRGTEALKLATDNTAIIDTRNKQLRADLAAQLSRAGAALPDYLVKHHDTHAATVQQDGQIDAVHDLVMTVRDLVRTSGLSSEVQKGWGIGQKMRHGVVADYLAAADTILHRAKDFPSEPARANVLATDLAALQQARDALKAADDAQTQKRSAAPLSTRERNDAARQVAILTGRVSAIGVAGSPKGSQLREEFRALVAPTKGNRKTPKPQ